MRLILFSALIINIPDAFNYIISNFIRDWKRQSVMSDFPYLPFFYQHTISTAPTHMIRIKLFIKPCGASSNTYVPAFFWREGPRRITIKIFTTTFLEYDFSTYFILISNMKDTLIRCDDIKISEGICSTGCTVPGVDYFIN